MKKEPRVRLDRLLVDRGLVESRARAEALILAGRVEVEGTERPKPGQTLPPGAVVRVTEPLFPWVSRGGVTLAGRLWWVLKDWIDRRYVSLYARLGRGPFRI